MPILIENFINVCLEALPFLALGFFIAGILKAFFANDVITKILGKDSSYMWSPIKGAILGAPIPLCSCSVIPVATTLKNQGANKGALTAFLVSAPETGADSLSISYALLGPIMMVARLISALSSAIITAYCVLALTGRDMSPSHKDKSCCKTTPQAPAPCCSKNLAKHPLWERFINGQRHAFTMLLDDTLKWMTIALALTAIMKTYIPTDFLAQHSYGVWAMVITVIISFPMYICASASTPIAAGLILTGVSPGVALVFMLAGPASNIATVTIVRRLMGTPTAILYTVCISICSIGAGLALNHLVTIYNWDIVAQASEHHIVHNTLAIVLSLFVIVCAIKPLRPYWGLEKQS